MWRPVVVLAVGLVLASAYRSLQPLRSPRPPLNRLAAMPDEIAGVHHEAGVRRKL